MIILTSPYGESLSDSSRYGSPSDSLLHVPLMVTAPGLLPRKENYDAQVSLVDLMPTILELLETPNAERVDGMPLFQKGKRTEMAREFVLGTVPFGNLIASLYCRLQIADCKMQNPFILSVYQLYFAI